MTATLREALRAAKHLKAPTVLCAPDGSILTQKMVRVVVGRAARKANLQSGVHRLRHTFCSHLAMHGIPARTIQEMAGHQDLTTTMRYMHMSPKSMDAAVLALDSPAPRGAEREAATA